MRRHPKSDCRRRNFRADERGFSRMISYMLTIGIAMILVTGLFVSGGALVEDQREQTTRTQLSVISQQIAGSVEAADRLAHSTESDPSELVLTRSLPKRLSGTGYTIDVAGSGDAIVVREMGGDLSVTASVDTEATITGSATGGSIEIVFSSSSPNDKLEISND